MNGIDIPEALLEAANPEYAQSKNDHKQFVIDFITKMNEQDNRCTATPYFYQIRDIEYVASYHQSEWDRLVASNGEFQIYDTTFEGIVKQLLDYGESINDLPDDLTDDYDVEECLNRNGFDVFREKESEKLTGCFFTETDAENHLKANHYHYSDRADTYINHCWRAPELEQFFKSVGKLCGVELKSK